MKSFILYIIDTLKKYNINLQSDFTEELQKSDNFTQPEKILSIYRNTAAYNLTITNLGIRYSKNSPSVFNSRIETIKKKPHWMSLFANNRILVPMSGFYEWEKESSQKIRTAFPFPVKNYFFWSNILFGS